MSKQELKDLEERFNDRLKNNFDQDFINRYQEVKPHLDSLEREIALQNNSLKDKDYEWMKWIIVIAAGVFSFIVTQVSKMALLSADQLFLLKIAMSLNALGIIFGAIYIHSDVWNGRDLIRKIQIQRYYLILENREKYNNVVVSDSLWFVQWCKPFSLLCFLIVMIIWVGFVWQLQLDSNMMAPNP